MRTCRCLVRFLLMRSFLMKMMSLVHPLLKNSEMLSKLEQSFSHLEEPKREDVVKLIRSHISLFSDMPTRTHVL